MGLTSGRGGRGARRRRSGYPGANDGQRGYTSLVSSDGYGHPGGPAARGGYAGHAGYASSGGYRGNAGTGEYAHRDGYGRREGDGYPEPDRYGRSGRLSAFIQRGGRRGGYRRAGSRRRLGISVPVISVVAVLASVAVVAAAVGVNRMLTARPAAADAPAANLNCTLIVPADPLTAGGLATPYQLTATDPASGPCNEGNKSQTAFVQGAVLDPATGKISVYNPLVIDAGTQPAVAPVVPTLPAGAVVAVWFGYNGDTLSLAGADQAQQLLGTASASPTDSAAATSTAPASVTPSQATPSDTG